MAPHADPADVSRAFAAAINAGDVAAASACWTSDAVIVGADGAQIRGRAGLEARFRELIAARVVLEIQVGDAIEVPQAAVARTRMTMRPRGGDPPLTFDATVVYVRAGDRWRLAVDRIDSGA